MRYAFVTRPDGATFRRGDFVRLNSGGPLMTIIDFETDDEYVGGAGYKAVCHWIALEPEPRIGVHSFFVETLTREQI